MTSFSKKDTSRIPSDIRWARKRALATVIDPYLFSIYLVHAFSQECRSLFGLLRLSYQTPNYSFWRH